MCKVATMIETSHFITTERLLERKNTFENILFDLTSKMLTSNELTFNTIINHALSILGTFSGADRAYVFMYRDEKTMDNTHEWVTTNISSEMDNLQQLPMKLFPNWVATLKKGNELYIHDVESLESNWISEKKILSAQDIKSVLVQPIIGQKKDFGFIGFDAVSSNMSWNKEERQLLRFFANTIGEALARKEYTSQLYQMREKAEDFSSRT